MIIDLQAAGEAVQASRPGLSIFLDATLAGFVITNIGLVAREVIRTRKSKKNGGNASTKPGFENECLKHRDKINILETKQKNTEGDITEIKNDVKELLRRTPSREG